MTRLKRTALRYHGGKWRLAPWIVSHFPDHRVYVEPFGGAASVLLRKDRSYAEVYNDLSGSIVNVFRVLRDRPSEIERAIRLTPYSRDEFEATYTEDSSDPVELARRTILRAYAGFGSAAATRGYQTGFRSSSNRSGTTPAHDWRSYPDHIANLAARLQGVVIENRDYRDVMLQHDGPETLHYCDPPYVHSTRRDATRRDHTYEHEMTDDDHRQLASFLRSLSGMVIVSGYRCDLYDELFGHWRRVDKETYADGARKRIESLWLSTNIRSMQLFEELDP